MSWDPSVLRKYNTTGHFRLLNQVRSELKANPLVRPKDGERIGEVNRSKALVRAIEAKQSSQARGRRQSSRDTDVQLVSDQQFTSVNAVAIPSEESLQQSSDDGFGDALMGFRNRLDAVDLR